MSDKGCRDRPSRRSRHPVVTWLLAAPADLGRFGGIDRVDAFSGLVRHQSDARVEEVETLAGLGGGARLDKLDDRLDAQLRHLDGVLLAGRVDDAVCDLGDTGAASVDRQMITSSPLLPAASSAWNAPYAAGSLIVYTTLMSGFLASRFSIAVRPPSSAPCDASLPTIV